MAKTTEKTAKVAKPKVEKAEKADKPVKKAAAPKAAAADKVEKAEKPRSTVPYTGKARFHDLYYKELRDALVKEFGYKNPMEIPRLTKIVLNMGVGEAASDRKAVDGAVKELTAIAGQKAIMTYAKKSIATFKLREFQPIGCKVTLRGKRMYEFLDRLVTTALPRVRDFRGISGKSFDGHGNYAFGIKEQIVFLEINYDQVDAIRGMDVIICTTAKTDKEAKALLAGFNMPFSKA